MSLSDNFNGAAEHKERIYAELNGRTTQIGKLWHAGDTLVFEPELGADLDLCAGYSAFAAATYPDKQIQFNWLGVAYNIAPGMEAGEIAQKAAGEAITPFAGTFTTKVRLPPEATKSAIDGDDIGALRTVLQHNAFPDAVFDDGGTPLTLAAMKDKGRNFVKLLVEHGADVNLAAKEGVTPLMAAALGGDVGSARILIDAGADITRVDSSGRAASEHATNPEMKTFLTGPYPAEAAERIRQKKAEEFAAAATAATVLNHDVKPMAKLRLKKNPR